MEKILQSVVKIIIIGILYETTFVKSNRQFPSPPIPYFKNQDYLMVQPGFVPPYAEHAPIYYQEPNISPPISYQNLNSFIPPQLFHQNENYNPSQFTNPGVSYSIPQVFPVNPAAYHAYKPEERTKYEVQQNNYKKPINLHTETHTEFSQKKPAFYATNIIVREENQPPYYHDEYNKNYQDEDYSDNYSDDSLSPSDPCLLNSPYRYFESPKPDLKNSNFDNKYVLCNPHFQPNFGNSVYTLKMPITLLPSRFPPRVEEFIERIQNYFSTYTQQETPKPQNLTSPSTTIRPPVTDVSSESETSPTATTVDFVKKNITEEEQPAINLEKTNSQPPKLETVSPVKGVTEETITVTEEAKEEEISSTASPDAQVKKEPQMVIQSQTTSGPNQITENGFVPTEVISSHQADVHTTDQYVTGDLKAQVDQTTVTSSPIENQAVKDLTYLASNADKTGSQMTSEKNFKSETDSTEMKEMKNEVEETNMNEPTQLQVKDNNG